MTEDLSKTHDSLSITHDSLSKTHDSLDQVLAECVLAGLVMNELYPYLGPVFITARHAIGLTLPPTVVTKLLAILGKFWVSFAKRAAYHASCYSVQQAASQALL